MSKPIFSNSQTVICFSCRFLWYHVPEIVTFCPNCGKTIDKNLCDICLQHKRITWIKYGHTHIFCSACIYCFFRWYFVPLNVKLTHLQKRWKMKTRDEVLKKIYSIDVEVGISIFKEVESVKSRI